MREPVFPPEEYMQTCEATYQTRKVKHIIVGLDRALRKCNSRIEAIQSWKEEMQSGSSDEEQEQEE